MSDVNVRDAGCCTACDGTGCSGDAETNGLCWDCRGTGHCHDGPCGAVMTDLTDKIARALLGKGIGTGYARTYIDINDADILAEAVVSVVTAHTTVDTEAELDALPAGTIFFSPKLNRPCTWTGRGYQIQDAPAGWYAFARCVHVLEPAPDGQSWHTEADEALPLTVLFRPDGGES